MKTLLFILTVLFVFTACESKSGKLDNTNVKAKLKVLLPLGGSEFTQGDFVIRHIDPMFNKGDEIKIGGTKFEIIQIDGDNIHDYQIDLYMDSVEIYTDDIFIAKVHYSKLDSVLLADNE